MKRGETIIDLWREMNWYAVQSKPHQENLAAARLAEFGIEVFLPRIKQEQSICGAWRVLRKPLFPGYFFARFCPSLLFDAVRYAQGVLRVVGTRRFPIPVEAEAISAIRERIQPDGFFQLQPNTFRRGDRVTIEYGPLAGWIGEVEREWHDGKRVLILLEAIQQGRMLVQKHYLAVATRAA